MTKRKGNINTRLKKLTVNNQMWFKDFIDWYINDKKDKQEEISEESINQYKSTIINVMELTPEHDVNLIDFSNIEQYLSDRRTPSDFNNKSSYLKKFFSFLSTRTTLSFDLDNFNLRFSSSDVRKSAKKSAKSLKMREIILLRNLLKNDIQKLFTFELVYQYGLTLTELGKCNEENYDFDKHIFSIKVNKKVKHVKVNEDIHNLISKNPKILKTKGKSAFDYHFDIISETLKKAGIIDRSISWQDIDKTRNEHFFKCAQCDNLYENTSKNWVLIQDESDYTNTKWIVCKNCGMNGDIYE